MKRLYVVIVAAGLSIAAGTPAAAGTTGTWTLETTPAGDGVTLSGVSCFSNGCVAVGYHSQSLLDVVYAWSGTAWAAQPAPSSASLNAVACSAANDCIAVGSHRGKA